MRFIIFILTFLVFFCPSSFSEEIGKHEKATIPLSSGESDSMTIYLNRIKEYFQKPDDKPVKTSQNVVDWLKESASNSEAWEYKVIHVQDTDTVNLQTNLNELGSDRWDCFFVREYRDGFYIFLKRHKIEMGHAGLPKDVFQFVSQNNKDEGK